MCGLWGFNAFFRCDANILLKSKPETCDGNSVWDGEWLEKHGLRSLEPTSFAVFISERPQETGIPDGIFRGSFVGLLEANRFHGGPREEMGGNCSTTLMRPLPHAGQTVGSIPVIRSSSARRVSPGFAD